MIQQDPLTMTKLALTPIAEQISFPDSPVGIDASYTHAVIITYLQQIYKRLDKIEENILCR